jgi:CBS domain-containing protein
MKACEKLIRDVMTRGVVTASAETLLKDIAEKMTDQHLSGVAVI